MNRTFLLVPLALVAGLLPSTVSAADDVARESGCRDIVAAPQESAASWDRLLEEISQSGDGSVLRPYSKAEPIWKNIGVAAATIQLAAASCSDVAYTAEFSRAVPSESGEYTTGELVSRLTVRGDGTSGVPVRGILDVAEDCVRAALMTSTPGGKLIDRAPDSGEVTICQDGGGGQTFGS